MVPFLTIQNKDCLIGMKEIPDEYFDYTITSPPYNRKRNDKYTEYDDTKNDYYDFLFDVVSNLLRITKNHIFFNVQTNYYNKKEIYDLIGGWSNYIQNIIIWEKSNPMPANGLNITNAYEMILVLGKKPLKALHTYTKNVITTSVNSSTTTKQHKAVMKQEVADWIVENFIPEESTIFDPMMGLGTTAIAAEKHNCKWFGYEIVLQYINLAYERIIAERRQRDFIYKK